MLQVPAGRPSLLDDEFIQTHTVGFDELRHDVIRVERYRTYFWTSQTQIAELADAYAAAERTIICYGMGITQHEHGTQNVQQLVNLLLMKGNIGKPGEVSAHYVVTLMYRATEPSVSPRNRLQSFWLAWVSVMASPHLMHLDMSDNCQHASNMYGAGSSIDLHGGQLCTGNARSGSERCTVNAIRSSWCT